MPLATRQDIFTACTFPPQQMRCSNRRSLPRRRWQTVRAAQPLPAGDWPWGYQQQRSLPAYTLAVGAVPERLLEKMQAPKAESFSLDLGSEFMLLRASDANGLRYGMLTLRDVFASGLALPCLSMTDWPALQQRGVMLDVGRVAERPETITSLMHCLAEQRANVLMLYLEDKIKIPGHEQIASPFAFDKRVLRRLSACAQRYGIQLVPSFSLFGHATHILNKADYAALADGPQTYQLNPLKQATRDLCLAHIDAWNAAVPDTPFMHMGCDETPYTGLCSQTRRFIEKHGHDEFFARHVRFLHQALRQRGQQICIWGDMLRHHPGIIPLLPHDVIIYDWNYGTIPATWRHGIEELQAAGLRVVAVPAASRSAELFMPSKVHLEENIPQFVELAVAMNLQGVMISTWEAMDLMNVFSRPGYVLGLRLAWTGDCRPRIVARQRQSAAAAVFGEANGPLFLKAAGRHGNHHFINHFRALHFDKQEPLKTYHLLTHELVPTDPVLYGTAAESEWTRTLQRHMGRAQPKLRAAVNGRQQHARLLRDGMRWLQMVDTLRSAARQQVQALSMAARAWQHNRYSACAARLEQAREHVAVYGRASGRCVQAAQHWWGQFRYIDDPEFDRCMSRRWQWAVAAARQWQRVLRQSLRQLQRRRRPAVFDFWQQRRVLQLRLPLQADEVNILILNIEASDAADAWRHHLNVQAFQLPGSTYCYSWCPISLPERLRFSIVRTQTPWTLDHLRVSLYALPDLEPESDSSFACDDYRLGDCVAELRPQLLSAEQAILDLRL